jgi:hypothetical protein
MEVFAIGHEYRHHSARHNTGTTASSSVSSEEAYRYEFEADEIALKVSHFLGRRGFAGHFRDIRNSWMESGAGAVALLVIADLISAAQQLLEKGHHADEESPAHPLVRDRVRILHEWTGYATDPLRERFQDMRLFWLGCL